MRGRTWIIMFALLIAACNDKDMQGQQHGVLKDRSLDGIIRAPEFPPGLQWLNADHPVTLASLRGKLVLLDFWTLGCINCIHILPDLRKLERAWGNDLVVIGVHSAKFTNEKGTASIRNAVLRYGIEHPVVNDNGFAIWNSYAVRAWPTLVLINPEGRIIAEHAGEGAFDAFNPILEKAVPYFSSARTLSHEPVRFARETEAASRSLLFPGKISADLRRHRLVITDSNHNRVLIADTSGEVLDVIGSGAAGRADGGFDKAAFRLPQGTALDGDILYIADTGNHLVRAADLRTRTVKTVFGTGAMAPVPDFSGTGTAIALNSPWDVLARGGTLYIAMAGLHQIWAADLATGVMRLFAGSGREGLTDGSPDDAALAQPSGLTTDGGTLYWVDSESSSVRSLALDGSGRVRTIAGEGLFEFGDVDGPLSRVRLQHPLGIAFADGALFIVDTYNDKIKKIDLLRGTCLTVAGTGKAGFDGGAARESRFDEPGGIAALDGLLYVADTNNGAVRVIDPAGGTVRAMRLSFVRIAGQPG